MKIQQEFTISVPCEVAWDFFQDLRQIASCIPGGEITGDDGLNTYYGKVVIRIGSFGATFEGEAKLENSADTRSGQLQCKGVDKRGGSRSRMSMSYELFEVDGKTRVAIDADVTLSGAIAQFGRTGLMLETANIIIAEFSKNLEQKLRPLTEGEPEIEVRTEISGISLLFRSLSAWIKKKISRISK